MTYPFVGGFALSGGTCAAASAGVLAIGLATGSIEKSYARVMAMMARMFVGGDAMMMADHVNNFNPAINRGEALMEWFERAYGTASLRRADGAGYPSWRNGGALPCGRRRRAMRGGRRGRCGQGSGDRGRHLFKMILKN